MLYALDVSSLGQDVAATPCLCCVHPGVNAYRFALTRCCLLHVQMAGLPQSVVQKAALIATQLKDRVELQQQEQQREQEADQGSAPPPAAAAAGTPSAVLEACNLVEGKVFKAVQQVVDVLRASGKGAQAGQQQQEGDHRPADVPGSQLAQVQQEIQQILVADVYQL